jgi:hypothetical protein
VLYRVSSISRDSSVGIGTSWGLDDQASFLGKGKIFFCTPQYSDGLWGPPSLLSNGYRMLHENKLSFPPAKERSEMVPCSLSRIFFTVRRYKMVT